MTLVLGLRCPGLDRNVLCTPRIGDHRGRGDALDLEATKHPRALDRDRDPDAPMGVGHTAEHGALASCPREGPHVGPCERLAVEQELGGKSLALLGGRRIPVHHPLERVPNGAEECVTSRNHPRGR